MHICYTSNILDRNAQDLSKLAAKYKLLINQVNNRKNELIDYQSSLSNEFKIAKIQVEIDSLNTILQEYQDSLQQLQEKLSNFLKHSTKIRYSESFAPDSIYKPYAIDNIFPTSWAPIYPIRIV